MWKFLSPPGPLVFPGPIFMNQREQALARIRPLQALRHKRDKHKGTMVFTNSTGAETPLWLISQSGCPAHTSSLTLWPQVSYVVETSHGNRWCSLLTNKVTVEKLLNILYWQSKNYLQDGSLWHVFNLCHAYNGDGIYKSSSIPYKKCKVSPLYSLRYETCFVLCSCLHLNRNQCPCETGIPITSLAVFFLCPLCNDSSASRRSSKCWREWTLIIDSWQLWHESKTFFLVSKEIPMIWLFGRLTEWWVYQLTSLKWPQCYRVKGGICNVTSFIDYLKLFGMLHKQSHII